MIFVAVEFRTQSTSGYPQLRRNTDRKQNIALLMCFNSALKGLFPGVERKTKSTEILATSHPGRLQRFHGYLLFALRCYLSLNSIHKAGFLFPPEVHFTVNLHIYQYHAEHFFLPPVSQDSEPMTCNEEGVGQKLRVQVLES